MLIDYKKYLEGKRNSSTIDWNFFYNKIKEHENIEYLSIKSNKKGIVFTDKKIAKRMINEIKPRIDETVFEPSVGGGVFIIAILEYIYEVYKPTPEEFIKYIENNIYFGDIIKTNIDFVKTIIEEIVSYFIDSKININGIVGDSLKNNKYFDIIIGNPPYIRIKNLEKDYLNFLRKSFKSCESGNIDIYYAFMEMTQKYSKRNILIVPNSYLDNKSAFNLREVLKDRVVSIRDFKETKKFSNASTYTSIIHCEKDKEDIFKFALYENDFKEFKREFLQDEKWNFGIQTDKERYELRTDFLKNICSIYSGIATLSDKLYLIDKNSFKNGYYTKNYNGIEYLIEKEICIDFKKISKNMGNNNQVIIFPYKEINKIVEEDVLKLKFPNTYKYFKAIKNDLNKRDKGKVEGYDNWFAYGRRQGFNYDFSNQKSILLPLAYKEDNFIYKEIKEKERFIHTSGYVIIPNKGEYDNVINILKSPDFQEYLLLFGKRMPGKDVNYNRITSTLLKKYGIK